MRRRSAVDLKTEKAWDRHRVRGSSPGLGPCSVIGSCQSASLPSTKRKKGPVIGAAPGSGQSVGSSGHFGGGGASSSGWSALVGASATGRSQAQYEIDNAPDESYTRVSRASGRRPSGSQIGIGPRFGAGFAIASAGSSPVQSTERRSHTRHGTEGV